MSSSHSACSALRSSGMVNSLAQSIQIRLPSTSSKSTSGFGDETTQIPHIVSPAGGCATETTSYLNTGSFDKLLSFDMFLALVACANRVSIHRAFAPLRFNGAPVAPLLFAYVL